MITFPNAKINLGLSITEKRPDGYHNLETVFYPVALEDALEIRTSPEADKKFSLHQYGMEISGNPEDNLVVKAYLLLDKEFHLCPIEIHLYKHIPSGAGLGGGSSDAAFMLKLLNEHFQLNLSEDQLEIYAAILKRISDSDHQTGCIRINAGSFRQYSPSSSRILDQRSDQTPGK